jgi:hypothetical protein
MFATGYSTDMASLALGVDAYVDMSPFDRAVI